MPDSKPLLGLLLGGKSAGKSPKKGGAGEARTAAARALLAAIKANDADALSEALGLHGSCKDDHEDHEDDAET